MYEEEAQLPAYLLIDAALEPLAGRGIYHYIRQRGDKKTGVILLKLNGLSGLCRMLIQQRDMEGRMVWVNASASETMDDAKAEAYIQRAILRDPDLWVIEIEDRAMLNPFEASR